MLLYCATTALFTSEYTAVVVCDNSFEQTTDVHNSGVFIATHVVLSMQYLQATLLNISVLQSLYKFFASLQK